MPTSLADEGSLWHREVETDRTITVDRDCAEATILTVRSGGDRGPVYVRRLKTAERTH